VTEAIATTEPPVWCRRTLIIDAAAMAGGALLAAVLLDPIAAGFAVLWWIATVVVVRWDLSRFIIPDTASAAIAGLGLFSAAGIGRVEETDGRIAALTAAALGGAVAFALFWLTAQLYRRASGRDGLGFGDVKLAGACGVWLGYADQAMALEVAAVAALAVVVLARRGRPERDLAVPFGAFLAPAAWLVFVAGPAVRHMVEVHG
jgi:prepilin signal peptidase PulO-like enzyme (type II secretory pathway)